MSYVKSFLLDKVNVVQIASKRTIQEKINKLANDSSNVAFSLHARERMLERDFTTKDVLDILKEGVITEDPVRESGNLKYKVESPHFRGGRNAAAITVINKEEKIIVVTVM